MEQSIRPVPGLRAFFMSYSTSTNNSVLRDIDNDLVSSGEDINEFSVTSTHKSLCATAVGGPPIHYLRQKAVTAIIIPLRSHIHRRQNEELK